MDKIDILSFTIKSKESNIDKCEVKNNPEPDSENNEVKEQAEHHNTVIIKN